LDIYIASSLTQQSDIAPYWKAWIVSNCHSVVYNNDWMFYNVYTCIHSPIFSTIPCTAYSLHSCDKTFCVEGSMLLSDIKLAKFFMTNKWQCACKKIKLQIYAVIKMLPFDDSVLVWVILKTWRGELLVALGGMLSSLHK
jgi:hypothetical protein